jgi:uncharacterized protein YjbI with pentapeptide repeats
MNQQRKQEAAKRFRPSSIVARLAGVLLWLGLLLWPTAAWADDYNQMSLMNRDFSGQNLTTSSFTKANLKDSNLRNTDFKGVSLFGANLENADLTGADLRGATLDSAKLSRANLTNANLSGAFAFNARFEGVIIDGADFTDVDLRATLVDKLCAVATGTNPTTRVSTRDSLNCP